MRAILSTLLLFIICEVSAQDVAVPNTFVDGETALAAEVNENFTSVVNAINARITYDLARDNTATGHQALLSNAEGIANTANGDNALRSNISGLKNSAFGAMSLYNSLGSNNTGLGYAALYFTTTGSDNTAVGSNSQVGLSTAESGQTVGNTSIGSYSLNANRGDSNTAIGSGALNKNTTGARNTAVGESSLYNSVSGAGNVAVGQRALFSNISGTGNSAVGLSALVANESGSFNTAHGKEALFSNKAGSENVAVGQWSGYNSKGSRNTFVGMRAGDGLGTGSNNTAIGHNADVGSTDLTNATVIGYNATVQASNTVRLGNANVVAVKTSGTFFSQGVQITSDARLKEDITPINSGLALINDLNPVSYHRIDNSSDDIEMGLLAQEVEEVLATHGLSNSGMVHQASEDAHRSVRYNDLLAPMIKALQELDAQHKQEVAVLREQLASQQEELFAVVRSQQKQIAQLQRRFEHQFTSR